MTINQVNGTGGSKEVAQLAPSQARMQDSAGSAAIDSLMASNGKNTANNPGYQTFIASEEVARRQT